MQLPAVEELLSSGAVPWSIAFTQRLGRHVTASRDIEPGACLRAMVQLRVPNTTAVAAAAALAGLPAPSQLLTDDKTCATTSTFDTAHLIELSRS